MTEPTVDRTLDDELFQIEMDVEHIRNLYDAPAAQLALAEVIKHKAEVMIAYLQAQHTAAAREEG